MKKLKVIIFNLLRKKRRVTKSRKIEVGKIKAKLFFTNGTEAEFLLVGEPGRSAEEIFYRILDHFKYHQLHSIDNIVYNPEVYTVDRAQKLAHVSHKVRQTYSELVKY
tara:strand:- start:3083 stop:3406 length:324 start_codon:yes stop_codon:yes gene_type:complete